jgi:hypothetical protein
MRKSWLWFVVKGLASLVLIGLLIAGGFAICYVGWTQGYTAGQLAAEGEQAAAPPPYLPYAFSHPGHFGFVHPLLCVGAFLLLLVVVGGFFRALAWHRMGVCGPWAMWHHWGPHPQQTRWAARWAKHWHRHGPVPPPWCWDWDEPCGEEGEGAEKKPDAEG